MITRYIDNTFIGSNYETAVKSDNRDFLVKLLMNSVELSCGVKRLEINKGSCGSTDQFSIGSIFGSSMTAEVLELEDDVKNQTLEVQVGLLVDNVWKWIKVGEYKISEVKKNQYGATLTGYGKIVTNTSGTFIEPANKTLANIATEIGNEMGCVVSFGSSSIDTSKVITASMNGLTTYQALQVLTSVIGGYAYESNLGNSVIINTYANIYNYNVDTSLMTSLPEVEEQDYEITGVRCVVAEASADSSGDIAEVGYEQGSPINLAFNDAYMTQSLFNDCATNLIGYTYRPGKINLSLGNPRLEGNEMLRVTDIDGSIYLVPLHQVRHIYDGGFRTEIVAVNATHLENDIGTVAPLQDFMKNTSQNFVKVESEIENLAEGIQYFWHDNDGAHVATIPQSTYIHPTAILSAYEVLITSNEILFRRGQVGLSLTWTWTTVATYANTGITLGNFASMTSSGIILGDINDTEYQMQLDSTTGIQLNGRPVVISDYATSAVSETTTTKRVVAGIVNDDSTQITFTVPLECVVPEGLAIDVTALRANIKIDGTSYFVDGTYMNQGRYWVVASNTYTVTALPAGTGLTIQIKKTTSTFKQGATSTAVAAYSSVTVEVDRVEWTKPAINRALRSSKDEESNEEENK